MAITARTLVVAAPASTKAGRVHPEDALRLPQVCLPLSEGAPDSDPATKPGTEPGTDPGTTPAQPKPTTPARTDPDEGGDDQPCPGPCTW